MPSHCLLPAELAAYVSQRFLADVPVRELVVELQDKFGHEVTPGALRQWVSRRGLVKRRREVDQKVCSIVSSAVSATIAKKRAEEPAKHLERWADDVVEIADKAVGAAKSSERARDLSAATSAVNTAIRLFRVVSGIEGLGDGPVKPANYNFDFSNNVVPISVEAGPDMASVVIEVPAAEPAT